MQSSKMTHWNRSTLWMGSRYKNMTQTVWNRILSCSRRKTPKKHTIYEKKRIYLYMWEVSYTNKRYIIYIYTSYYYSHPIVNPQKSWHPTSKPNSLSWPTGRFHMPLRSKSQSLPGGTNVDLRIDRHVTGGGNLWKDQPPLKTKVVPFKRW